MPNHFHLLVCTPKGNLSEFMRHFNISYTGAFNRKYERSGHLYQGRYKAFLVDKDNYLLEVSRYIHLNPLGAQSRKSLREARRELSNTDVTSLPGYLSPAKQKPFVHYDTILDYFDGDSSASRRAYWKFVSEGLKRDIPDPLEQRTAAGIIGTEEFVESVKRELEGRKTLSARELSGLRDLEQPMKPDYLIDRFSRLVMVDKEGLIRKGKQSMERSMLMEFLYRLCGMTQPEIGKLLGGIDYSAVSQARKRLHLKMEQDPRLSSRFAELGAELSAQMSSLKI